MSGNFSQLDGPGYNKALSVTTTAQEVVYDTTPLSERKIITIQPLNGDIYYGYSNGVTTSNGTKIFSNQFFPLEVGPELRVWVITATGTVDVRISEVA